MHGKAEEEPVPVRYRRRRQRGQAPIWPRAAGTRGLKTGSTVGWCPARGVWRLAPIVLGLAVLAGCAATPPAPLVPSPAARSSMANLPDASTVVVAVDSISGGYNPHQIADQSTITDALSTLLLPSVFRTGPDGTPRLDRTLMVSAEVTSAQPFTVTYTLRTDANWSDGTPVDAADFVYLRTQMSTQPNVVDPAGYRLISDITARDNGKVIQVTFAKPYPGWRSLFTDLLPGHLLKDAPGGWASALSDGFLATAGPFAIKKLDAGADEIVLERNDRYWDRPTALGQIVLRKTGPQGIVDALRSNADQLALTSPNAAGLALLGQLGAAVNLGAVPQPELTSVLLRPGAPQLADPSVRAAVAAALDRTALINTGTGGGPSLALPAGALVTPPSAAGYAATMPTSGPPAAPDPASIPQLLAQAGFVRQSGGWTKDGHPLNLVIAAPANEAPYDDIARQVRQQLTTAGIAATVQLPPASQLYGQWLVAGSTSPVDVLVGPHPVGGDPATELASEFGCSSTLPGTATPAPDNELGWCDSTLQPTIDAALTGELPMSTALATVEPALWAQDVEIPLFQHSVELAIGRQVKGVSAGPPLVGPFSGASDWNRSTG